MKCPGQDRRYWKGDMAFDVPCPQCGAMVELFRDESTGRCPRCSNRFPNPGADFGCAQWCALANECLGYAPQRQAATAERPLAARVIQAVAEAFKHNQTPMVRALKVFQYAKELAVVEGGDPCVVLTAALLLEIDSDQPGSDSDAISAVRQNAIDAPLPKTREILQHIGLTDDTAAGVCQIIEGLRTGTCRDTLEFNIVSDSVQLVALSIPHGCEHPDEAATDRVLAALRTAAGRQKLLSMLQSQGKPTR
jgi:hypothetical protein